MAGWLLAQAGHRGARRAADDRAGPRRRPYRADADGTLARPRAAGAVRPQCRAHRRARAPRQRSGRWRWSPAPGLPISQATSLAGEPRDDVSFDGAAPEAVRPAAVDQDRLVSFGAAVRLQQMAGALEKILDQSVQCALDRVQFGRPIAKFQAVQHNLATLAGEVAAAGAAADAAAEACAHAGDRRSARSRSPRCASARRPAPAPRSRIRCTARWASPTSIRCITRRAGCGPGARSSATRRIGPRASAGWSAERGADALWPFRHRTDSDREAPMVYRFPLRPGRAAARGQGIAPGGPRLSAPGDRGRHLLAAWRQGRRFRAKFSRKVGARGWIGMTWPKQYGGHERSHLERYVVTEEMLAAPRPDPRLFDRRPAERPGDPALRPGGDQGEDPAADRVAANCASASASASPIPARTCSPPRPARPRPTAAGWSTAARSGPATRINADYMIALLRTSPPTKENRRHGLTQFLVDMQDARGSRPGRSST